MQIKQQSQEWAHFLSSALEKLVNRPPLRFLEMTPNSLPKTAGVYLITGIENGEEIPYYIGRSKNLRQRLYNNHLMGPLTNARLKKYLIGDGVCSNIQAAKEFILRNCAARWIEEENYRRRGAIEGSCTSILFPKYGIDEEH